MAKKEKKEKIEKPKKEKKPRKVKQMDAAEDSSEEGGGRPKTLFLILIIAGAVVIAVAGFLVGRFLLGGGEEPVEIPTTYMIMEESVPALPVWQLMEEDPAEETEEPDSEGEDEKDKEKEEKKEELKFELEEGKEPEPPKEDEEEGEGESEAPGLPEPDTYSYSNLTGTGELLAGYLTALVEENEFVVVNESLEESELPELPAGSGAVHLARKVEGETWLCSLQITWDESSCTVLAGPLEGSIEYQPAEGLTAYEALDYINTLPPSALGLEGSTMADYHVYLINGVVMADGHPCIHINVYGDHPEADTNLKMGSYLISADQRHIYQLDEVNGTITELKLP